MEALVQTSPISERRRVVMGAPSDSSTADVRECLVSLLWALIIMAPVLAVGGHKIFNVWWERESARLAAIEAAQAYERLLAAPPLSRLEVAPTAHGRDVFMTVCAACHGTNSKGVAGLGKDLVESDFVAGQDDEALQTFLSVGRPDARPAPMPPKGGRDDLNQADLADVVKYLRGIQDPRRMPELPAIAAIAPPPLSEADKAAALAAAGGDAELAEYIANGNKLFHTTCIACHGAGGIGVKGNGKALVNNEFVSGLDDDSLLAFIKRGRDPSDPKNTTGIGMPARGGNPALSDDDLLDIISYLRTLQTDKSAASTAVK